MDFSGWKKEVRVSVSVAWFAVADSSVVKMDIPLVEFIYTRAR